MAADIVQDDVLGHAAELGTGTPVISDTAWNDVLRYANKIDLCDDVDTRRARIMLAAHILSMTRRGGSAATGPITSEASGNLRRTYGFVGANLPSGSGSYHLTKYGQMFQDVLLASAVNGPGVI